MTGEKKKILKELINGLQEDLSREYQAIIAYTVYGNVLSGAQWMKIAEELKKHAHEELAHAMIIADQIDYLGAMPNAKPNAVKLSEKAEEMLRFDLDNETETIKAYRTRASARPRRWGIMRWPSRFGKSLRRSRSISMIWRRRWGLMCRIF